MRTLSLASMLILCSGAGAQDLTIADIAPEEAFLVLGVDNASTSLESFKSSGLWSFMQDPEIADWLSESFSEAMDDIDTALASIDASIEDFSEPTGMVGVAMWLNAPAEDAEGNDALPTHFLMSAGFGDEAAGMHDMIVRALEEGENEETLTYESDRMGDAVIYTIRPTEAEMEEDWDDEWGDDEWGDDDWGGGAGPMDPPEFYYAQHGEHLLMSTSMGDIENALSRIDGVDIDNASGTASFSRLKPAGEHDAYMVLLNGPLYDMADSLGENEDMAMMGVPPIMPILDALGLSEVRGLSLTLDFDEAEGDTVAELFVSAPRLRGLMSLINVPDKPFTAPSFVSPDVANVNLFQFDVANLIPALQQSLNNMPAEIAGQGQFFLQMAAGQLGPLLSQLGPELYSTTTFVRPFSAQSQQNLFAIASKDDEELVGAIAMFAPQMGLEGRDFQGNQIWSAGAGFGGGMLPMPENGFSMGVGFGYLFIGPDAAVEGAMRQAAGGDNAFAENESFKNAMTAVGNNGLSFGYTNLAETLAYQAWTIENFDEVMEAQMEAMGGGRGMMPMGANPIEDLQNLEKLSEVIGDSVQEFQLVDGGIKGTFIVLRPTE
ncbi:MAG: hypothetical protein AAGH64_07370 [Planctomycetota bacterium]